MQKLILTIDPQPTLTAVCVRRQDGIKSLYKIPFVPKKRKSRDKILLGWMNHDINKMSSHFRTVFDLIETNNPSSTFDSIYIEGQWRGKAMIGLECFLKGWLSASYPNAVIDSLPAMTWKKILFILGYTESEHAPKGKELYFNQEWQVIQEECIEINDLCPDDNEKLREKNDDIVDAFLMMKYVENKFL